MKKYTNIFLILFVFAFYSIAKAQNTQEVVQNEPTAKENIAYKWAKMALLATANDTEKFKPRPTITSRYLGLSFIAIFDSWSRYDDMAIPVYLNKVDRQAPVDRTLNNKEIAVSYAAYHALSKYFYSDKKLFYDFMIELGLDPDNFSLDPNTPEGIGNLAATAVFEARKNDGSNQDGEEVGSNGKAYFDYIKYTAINSADDNTDINHWQPKYFSDGKGGQYLPECLTPFWGKVKPVSLKSASQFRPIPPPLVGSEKLKKEVEEVIKLQENLTNEQKALVEFMRDGPMSVQQAGHWLTLAQEVSVRDNHTLDEDVKMYFLCEITAMDCFIACWDSKLFYDYARPYALVHHYYKDITIKRGADQEKELLR